MSYQSMSDLNANAGFRARVTTCAKEQALIFKDDGRYPIASLAHAVIVSPTAAAGLVELVAVAPNFRDVTNPDAIPDADILAAVQAQWPTYAEAIYPEPPAQP